MKLTGWVIALAAAAMAPAATAATGAATAEPVTTAATEDAVAPAAATGEELDAATTPDGEPAGTAYAAMTPEEGIGVPDGRMGLQDQYTEIGQQAANFHNNWLLPLCIAISVFVLLLMLYTMVRFRRSANPEPSRTSHNTLIEVIWTIVPVLILVAIAIPSIKLINAQYSPPPADLTVKVTGNQWYWTYSYPDNGDMEIVSNMLKEEGDPSLAEGARFRTAADGPALLAVDERLVIPAGKTVKFLVTSADVIHSFALPAFWVKMDAVPGKINETWVKVDRPGVYFGQCSELCGARHGYMPIAIEVLPEDQFNAWVASKGGSIAGAAPEAPIEVDVAGSDDSGTIEATPAATPADAQPNEAPVVN